MLDAGKLLLTQWCIFLDKFMRFLPRRPLLLTLAFLVFSPACRQGMVPAAPAPESHREWNDIARLLGGLEPLPGSTIASSDSTQDAARHRQYFAKIWTDLEKNQLEPQRKWAAEKLGVQKGFVFYPFSGPDFLNIYTFYPEGKEYLMFGLEPTGEPPHLKDLSAQQVSQGLAGLQVSMRSILNLSFFQTLHMINDLKATRLSGVAPVLLAFVARTGHTVLSVRNVRLLADGTIETLADPYGTQGSTEQKPAGDHVPGIRIIFQKNGNGDISHVDYFSVDISNEAIAKKPYFFNYIRSKGAAVTYLKAASYLMHNQSFSSIRDFILDTSDLLLQDDSGMPYAAVSKEKFDVKLYGAYTRPIPLFDGRYQADLRAAYKDAEPLPFGIGYKWGKGESNLMIARKKQQTK